MRTQKILVALLMVAMVIMVFKCKGPQDPSRSEASMKAQANERLKIAMAKYQEHCKSAGEKIYKTVENVDGIFLMKIRPKEKNFDNQFAMTDPYGDDLGGDGYIESLLRGSYDATHIGVKSPGSPPRTGYNFVEAMDPKDGLRYRYTGQVEEIVHHESIMMGGDPNKTFKSRDFVLKREPVHGDMPRYGVTYDDISTHEDREYWIAGSSLKVIDLKTNEVIAERIGYMVDLGQGETGGGRAPWSIAADHACPSFIPNANIVTYIPGSSGQAYQTEDFVEKVLKPTFN